MLSYREYKELESIAFNLIEKYHKNDVDKGKNPYINHLISVSDRCKSYESKIVALLHDIIEDTNCNKEVLLDLGIPNSIVDSILIVSRKEDETYNEFIDRIIDSKNVFAIEVKYSDLIDNCDLSRLNNISDEEVKKVEKMVEKRYIPALIKIQNKLKELEVDLGILR